MYAHSPSSCHVTARHSPGIISSVNLWAAAAMRCLFEGAWAGRKTVSEVPDEMLSALLAQRFNQTGG